MVTNVVIGHIPNGSLRSSAKSPHNRLSKLPKSAGGMDRKVITLNDRPERSSASVSTSPPLSSAALGAAEIELDDFIALSGRAAGR
jgi:hypothetical protein